MPAIHLLTGIIGFASLALAAGYAVLVLIAVLVWHRPRSAKPPSTLPPVTVLKPLCGFEPSLHKNLRSFCLQDYRQFQTQDYQPGSHEEQWLRSTSSYIELFGELGRSKPDDSSPPTTARLVSRETTPCERRRGPSPFS